MRTNPNQGEIDRRPFHPFYGKRNPPDACDRSADALLRVSRKPPLRTRAPARLSRPGRLSLISVALAAWACVAIQAAGQVPVPPPAPEVQLRSGAELDQMLGPIALYPDPLLAEMLPAATTPEAIVLADRYVSAGGDPNLIEQQGWSASVNAMAMHPELLKWMDDNLAWTTAVGEAFLYQPQDVMDSIQRLRAQAMALGNLQSTPQQNVVMDNGIIEILPANPQVVYVPVYQPNVIYYQRGYGRPLISFGVHFTVGPWFNHDFDWRAHHVIIWHRNQPRPADWWSPRTGARPRPEANHAAVWRPGNRPRFGGGNIDRGWGTGQRAFATSQPRRPGTRPARPAVQPRPATLPTRPRSPGGAFIGIQSSREARQFSSRGRASRETANRRTEAPHPRPEPDRTAGRRR
jgi:Protein of unknown function (DUF3300)